MIGIRPGQRFRQDFSRLPRRQAGLRISIKGQYPRQPQIIGLGKHILRRQLRSYGFLNDIRLARMNLPFQNNPKLPTLHQKNDTPVTSPVLPRQNLWRPAVFRQSGSLT